MKRMRKREEERIKEKKDLWGHWKCLRGVIWDCFHGGQQIKQKSQRGKVKRGGKPRQRREIRKKNQNQGSWDDYCSCLKKEKERRVMHKKEEGR